MNYNDIYSSAKQVRKVLEKFWSNAPYIDGFYPFPRGWCGTATDILGAYFQKLDPKGNYEKIIGMLGERSHAWLEHNGYIIDITADQFERITNQPVIVEKIEDNLTHKNFEIEERIPLYTEHIYSNQPEAYLLSKLSENNYRADN